MGWRWLLSLKSFNFYYYSENCAWLLQMLDLAVGKPAYWKIIAWRWPHLPHNLAKVGAVVGRPVPSNHHQCCVCNCFSACSRNPLENIVQRVKDMGEVFCTKYNQVSLYVHLSSEDEWMSVEVHSSLHLLGTLSWQPSEDQSGSHIDFARRRLQLAEGLYYKALENIMSNEKKRLEGRDTQNLDFSVSHLLRATSWVSSDSFVWLWAVWLWRDQGILCCFGFVEFARARHLTPLTICLLFGDRHLLLQLPKVGRKYPEILLEKTANNKF